MKNPIYFAIALFVAAVVAVSLIINPAHAADLCDDDLRLIGGGWSHHISGADNETHNAMGLQCNGWSAFTFKNSNGDDALAVGREWMPWERGGLSFGGYGGAWFGYFPDSPAAFIPVLAARGRWQPAKHFAVSVTTVIAVSTVHLEWQF